MLMELHPDTRLLYQTLAAVKPGEDITYEALSKAVGYLVKGGNSHLQSALRIAFRDADAVFGSVRGVGYHRMTPEEIAKNSKNDVKSVRRVAARKTSKLFKAPFDQLSPEAQREFNTSSAILGSVSVFLTPQARKQVDGAVAVAGKEIPVAETMRIFAR